MTDILSVENMRKSDAHTIDTEVSGIELMYRAGVGIVESSTVIPPVAIVCGSGNNAGDGYVCAMLLKEKNVDVALMLLKDKFSPDGRYYFDKCMEMGVKWEIISGKPDFSGYNTIIDCVLGTGFTGDVRGLAADVIDAINASACHIISADINSGLNGDSGMSQKCVISDETVSVGSFKPGHFLGMAKDMMKKKVNCDIGIRPVEKAYHLFEKADVRASIPERKNISNKGTYGYVALIGGSLRFSGAIRLAHMANAAMVSGAGVAQAAVPSSLCPLMIPQILEATLYPMPDKDGEMIFDEKALSALLRRVKTVAFGMGIGVSEETKKILSYILGNFGGTLIIDADGLTMLSGMDYSDAKCRIILTPHLKEFSRLTGLTVEEIESVPVDTAVSYAREHGCTVLLKGASTVVTDGNEVYIVDRGCAGMATAGSGDVLSGILAAMCAYVPDTLRAAASAAYINGRAGEEAELRINPVSMTAGDTVREISAVFSDILNA